MNKARYNIKGSFEWLSRNRRMLMMTVIVIAAFVAGLALRSNDGQASVESISHGDHAHAASEEPSAWTCSMHPQIQLPKAGKCPICFMDLIPVESDNIIGESQLDPRQLRMTPAAMKLADIQTSPVIRADAKLEIRLPGRVAYDETRVAQIAAWVPGRITKLYADYTGVRVKRGEPMVELYSPALYSAQKELLSAVELVDKLKHSSSSSLTSTAQTTLDAARKKLVLLGLTQKQVADLETDGLASEYITIPSPTSGIGVEK